MRKTKGKFLFRKYFPLVKKFIIAFSAGFIAFFIVKTLLSHQYFSIKSYTHSGVVKFVNTDDFEKVVNANVLGQNIFKFNTKDFEDSLKKNFLGIQTVKIHKNYFEKLTIQIQERVPIAIVIDNSGARYLIDSFGYVLGLVEESYFDLPSLNYDDVLNVGQFVDSKIVPTTLEIIKEAKIEDVQISSVSFKPDYVTFFAEQATSVYIDNEENIRDSIKIIARLLSKAVLESKSIIKIDLRYDKVIVLYN